MSQREPQIILKTDERSAFVAVPRNHAEIALTHANRESPKSAAMVGSARLMRSISPGTSGRSFSTPTSGETIHARFSRRRHSGRNAQFSGLGTPLVM